MKGAVSLFLPSALRLTPYAECLSFFTNHSSLITELILYLTLLAYPANAIAAVAEKIRMMMVGAAQRSHSLV